jgi:hypothetical protein
VPEEQSQQQDSYVSRMSEIATELAGMRNKTRQTAVHRVVIGLIAFVIAVVTAITLHDQHVAHCMVFARPASRSEQKICNAFFPFHEHPIGTRIGDDLYVEVRPGVVEVRAT